MIRQGHELRIVENKNMRGGDGTVILRHLIEESDFSGKGRLFSHITVNQGCSVGYHEHQGETEVYAVMSGTGVFNDNGQERMVYPGDVTITKSGEGHGMACAGSQPLELVALIFFD